ncbi:MAG: penicillin-binding protein 2 [bacterium]
MKETRMIRTRLSRVFILCLFAVLVVNLFILQVPYHQHYQQRALKNRQVQLLNKAPRGLIKDRDGTVLANNRFIFDVTIPAICLTENGPDSTLQRLLTWWDLPLEETCARLTQQRERGRNRLVLVTNATMPQVHAVKNYQHHLPGVEVEERARRHYVHGSLFAHVIGYVGEVGQERIDPADQSRSAYRLGDMAGVQGVEVACEDSLRGLLGVELVEINAARRVVARRVEEWQGVDPVPGHDVTLSLSLALQESLRTVLLDRIGCGVAIALPSGEVLAAYSSPAFDPNLLTASISPAEWDQLVNDPRKPFFNRVLQATYPASSLFKVVTSLAGLRHGVVGMHSVLDPCYGGFEFGDRVFHCWNRGGHGAIDHSEALAHSCDIYYYQLGLRLTVDQLAEAAREFGLGSRCGTIFSEEVGGIIPTRAWYNNRFGDHGWTRGVLLNLAIGQGEILVTPLQMAMLAAQIATSGRVGSPTFILREGRERKAPQLLSFREEHLRWVRKGMEAVVDMGTGQAAKLAGIAVAGKTGTAQNPHGEDHAWFMCYAPARAPEVAVALILENAGHGGAEAAPLVGTWLRGYFNWAARRGVQ